MKIKTLLQGLLEKLLVKFLPKLEKIAAETGYSHDGPSPEAPGSTPENPHDEAWSSPVPWSKCKKSSNWNGSNAQQRMMNMLSPKFDDKKFGDYLSWIVGRGCDHVHLFLLNQGDGEGAGYDCCTDAKANALALTRLKVIRSKGLGIVLWVVADDSPDYRARLFANPAKYAKGASNLLPHASAIVVGLEMNEGKPTPSVDQWKAVRAAFESLAPGIPLGVHHTSGNEFKYASVGDFICGQLNPGCSTSDIKKQIAAIKAKGKEAVGFEYERKPDRARAQAALNAGAHAVGNW